jgi:hypothetical protein
MMFTTTSITKLSSPPSTTFATFTLFSFRVRLASIRGSLAAGKIAPRGFHISQSGTPLLSEA